MVKVCENCHTENPADAVFCSECGMSLTRAPIADSAAKAIEDMGRARSVRLAAPPTPVERWWWLAILLVLGAIGFVSCSGTLIVIYIPVLCIWREITGGAPCVF